MYDHTFILILFNINPDTTTSAKVTPRVSHTGCENYNIHEAIDRCVLLQVALSHLSLYKVPVAKNAYVTDKYTKISKYIQIYTKIDKMYRIYEKYQAAARRRQPGPEPYILYILYICIYSNIYIYI